MTPRNETINGHPHRKEPMESPKTKAITKAATVDDGTSALAKPPDRPASQPIALPPDPAGQRKALKNIFIDKVGANVFAGQMRPFVGYTEDDAGQSARDGAEAFVRAIKESVQPRDAVEEMLVLQMAWTHARLAVLSSVKSNQEAIGALRAINDACDRCAGTFRKLMLALSEHRRPAQVGFVAIKQANVANQQVVQHVNQTIESPEFRKPIASNEQGSALPAVGEGAGILAGDGAAQPAVEAQHRPQNGGREGAIPVELDEAR